MAEQPKKKRFIPIWIWVLITLELIAITGVTIVGIQDITVMHPDQAGPSYLASLYITRNLVAVVGLALTTYVFRSYIALFLALLARVATEVSDFTNSYVFGRSPEYMEMLPYLIFLMVVIPTVALVMLWPDVRREMSRLSER